MKRSLVLALVVLPFPIVSGGDPSVTLEPGSPQDDAVDRQWYQGVRREQSALANELEKMVAQDPQVTLYTIDPNEDGWWFSDGRAEWVDNFRRYPILGKANITDKNDRLALIRALVLGMREWNFGSFTSFRPRRALTITTREKKLDILVDFGFRSGRVWGSYAVDSFSTSSRPGKEFDRIVLKYRLADVVPNFPPGPTPTSVTPAAGEAPRQP
jgi:hypothetical protein